MAYMLMQVDRVEEEKIVYNGLDVMVISRLNNIEGFEKMNWYMQSVDGEIIIEAVETIKKYMRMAQNV